MKHIKHTKLYERTKNYADFMGVSIFDVAEFALYTPKDKYINTVTFRKMCDMIQDKCVFMSKSKHTPEIAYDRDYRLVSRYQKIGFTVYCLTDRQFNFFTELYFDYS